jgi:hypothetical protein
MRIKSILSTSFAALLPVAIALLAAGQPRALPENVAGQVQVQEQIGQLAVHPEKK